MGKDVPAEAVDQMTANFILPQSKDMPGSKEPFDEVIFVELSRDDAQTNLDEMKHLLPRTPTPSYDNLNNQNVSSTYTGIVYPGVPGVGPSLSGYQPPMNNSYGQGLYAPGAPVGVQGFQCATGNQHQIQSSYFSAPYEHQTQTSYPNPSYPNTSNQHQIYPNYPSTANQNQIYGSYPSSPFPGYEYNAYGSHGSPRPYNQQVPSHDGVSSWSSGNYGPYGQQSLDVHNTGLQYAAPVAMPPGRGVLPPPIPSPPRRGNLPPPIPRPPPRAPLPPYYMSPQPSTW